MKASFTDHFDRNSLEQSSSTTLLEPTLQGGIATCGYLPISASFPSREKKRAMT
jgi:hypothetical protein